MLNYPPKLTEQQKTNLCYLQNCDQSAVLYNSNYFPSSSPMCIYMSLALAVQNDVSPFHDLKRSIFLPLINNNKSLKEYETVLTLVSHHLGWMTPLRMPTSQTKLMNNHKTIL
jgi:hypothetical protein